MSEKKISDQTNPESRKSIPLDWSYAEALENTSHATFNKSNGLFINGSFTNYDESQSFESINPANGEAIYRCTEASESDVDSAVKVDDFFPVLELVLLKNLSNVPEESLPLYTRRSA